MTLQPDIFVNVHKGIRRALFDACVEIGRAAEGTQEFDIAKRALDEALHFVRHHGDNEDLLLLPLLKEKAPEIAARMERAHERINAALAALDRTGSAHEIYLRVTCFIALYLDHMREEEEELDALIRDKLDADALATVSRVSVQRTAPHDQRMMLGWVVPAMPRAEADALLGKLPKDLAEDLSSKYFEEAAGRSERIGARSSR